MFIHIFHELHKTKFVDCNFEKLKKLKMVPSIQMSYNELQIFKRVGQRAFFQDVGMEKLKCMRLGINVLVH